MVEIACLKEAGFTLYQFEHREIAKDEKSPLIATYYIMQRRDKKLYTYFYYTKIATREVAEAAFNKNAGLSQSDSNWCGFENHKLPLQTVDNNNYSFEPSQDQLINNTVRVSDSGNTSHTDTSPNNDARTLRERTLDEQKAREEDKKRVRELAIHLITIRKRKQWDKQQSKGGDVNAQNGVKKEAPPELLQHSEQEIAAEIIQVRKYDEQFLAVKEWKADELARRLAQQKEYDAHNQKILAQNGSQPYDPKYGNAAVDNTHTDKKQMLQFVDFQDLADQVEEENWWQIAGEVVLGFTPFGIILDIADFVVALGKGDVAAMALAGAGIVFGGAADFCNWYNKTRKANKGKDGLFEQEVRKKHGDEVDFNNLTIEVFKNQKVEGGNGNINCTSHAEGIAQLLKERQKQGLKTDPNKDIFGTNAQGQPKYQYLTDQGVRDLDVALFTDQSTGRMNVQAANEGGCTTFTNASGRYKSDKPDKETGVLGIGMEDMRLQFGGINSKTNQPVKTSTTMGVNVSKLVNTKQPDYDGKPVGFIEGTQRLAQQIFDDSKDGDVFIIIMREDPNSKKADNKPIGHAFNIMRQGDELYTVDGQSEKATLLFRDTGLTDIEREIITDYLNKYEDLPIVNIYKSK